MDKDKKSDEEDSPESLRYGKKSNGGEFERGESMEHDRCIIFLFEIKYIKFIKIRLIKFVKLNLF